MSEEISLHQIGGNRIAGRFVVNQGVHAPAERTGAAAAHASPGSQPTLLHCQQSAFSPTVRVLVIGPEPNLARDYLDKTAGRSD